MNSVNMNRDSSQRKLGSDQSHAFGVRAAILALLSIIVCGSGVMIAVGQHSRAYSELIAAGEDVLHRVAMTTRQSAWELNYVQVQALITSEMNNQSIEAILIYELSTQGPALKAHALNPTVPDKSIPLSASQNAFKILSTQIINDQQEIAKVEVYLTDAPIRAQLRHLYAIISLIVLGVEGLLVSLVWVGQKLIASRRAAEEANRAKSDFLAKMSHEIRTPMNGVIGMTLLALNDQQDPTQREYLSTIKSSADTLLVIINDILDFSKIEAGMLVLSPEEFSIARSLAETMDLIGAAAKGKSLEIVHAIHDLPAYMLGDQHRFKQILINIVGNAIKFTPPHGGVIVQAWIDQTTDAYHILHCSISDTGIGIPADKLDNIFDAFTQAESTTTRKFGGTGLGLTISKQLVNLMGGEIWVKSLPGVGSTFHFTVKFGKSSGNHQSSGAQIAAQLDNTSPGFLQNNNDGLGQLSILVADDNVINQRISSAYLTKRGHLVQLASNGLDAIKLMQSEHFDIILMDLQMPVMDGLEATRHIRGLGNEHSQIPIIALTADVLSETREQLFTAGMNGFVTKPFNPAQLMAEIKRVIEAK